MPREVYKVELDSLLADGALLVDVREVTEHDVDSALPGHTHVPLSQLSQIKSRLAASKAVVFYCRSGLLSFQAAEMAGIWTAQPVYYLAGGLLSLASTNDA